MRQFANSDCGHLFVLLGFGDICPRGYMCPLGSTLPEGCAPGMYQDEEGQPTCKTCLPGMLNFLR